MRTLQSTGTSSQSAIELKVHSASAAKPNAEAELLARATRKSARHVRETRSDLFGKTDLSD